MTNAVAIFYPLIVVTNILVHQGRFIDDSTGRQWDVAQGFWVTNREQFTWDGQHMTARTNTDIGPKVGGWVLTSRGSTNVIEVPPPLPQMPHRSGLTQK